MYILKLNINIIVIISIMITLLSFSLFHIVRGIIHNNFKNNLMQIN